MKLLGLLILGIALVGVAASNGAEIERHDRDTPLFVGYVKNYPHRGAPIVKEARSIGCTIYLVDNGARFLRDCGLLKRQALFRTE